MVSRFSTNSFDVKQREIFANELISQWEYEKNCHCHRTECWWVSLQHWIAGKWSSYLDAQSDKISKNHTPHCYAFYFIINAHNYILQIPLIFNYFVIINGFLIIYFFLITFPILSKVFSFRSVGDQLKNKNIFGSTFWVPFIYAQ